MDTYTFIIKEWMDGYLYNFLKFFSSCCYQGISSRFCICIIIFLGTKICCSVAQLCPTLRPHGLQNARLPCSSPPGACSLMFIESMMLSNHLILCRTALILVNFPFFSYSTEPKASSFGIYSFLKKILSKKHVGS